MKTLVQGIRRFWNEEEGAVAIEYGLLAVLIALIMAFGAAVLGNGLNVLFTNLAGCFNVGTGTCPVTLPSPL